MVTRMPNSTAAADIAVGTMPTLILAIPVWRSMVRGLINAAVRG